MRTRPHTPTLQRPCGRDDTARARDQRGAGQPSSSYRRTRRGATAATDTNVLRRFDHDLEAGREIDLQVQNGAQACWERTGSNRERVRRTWIERESIQVGGRRAGKLMRVPREVDGRLATRSATRRQDAEVACRQLACRQRDEREETQALSFRERRVPQGPFAKVRTVK